MRPIFFVLIIASIACAGARLGSRPNLGDQDGMANASAALTLDPALLAPLGLPDVRELPLVEPLGRFSQRGIRWPVEPACFVVERSATNLRAVCRLEMVELPLHPAGDPAGEETIVEPLPFERAVQRIEEREPLSRAVVSSNELGQYAPRLEVAQLALAAAARGQPAVASRLLARIATTQAELEARVAEDVAGQRFARALAGYADGASRPSLEAELERIARDHPMASTAARARSLAKVMARMIQEDATPSPAAANRLELAMASAVHQMREHSCAAFESSFSSQWKRPGRELRQLGVTAIPTLIALTDDARVTRCLGRDGLERYSEIALGLLSELAHRTLTTKAEAESWAHARPNDGCDDQDDATVEMLADAKAMRAPELVAMLATAHGHLRADIIAKLGAAAAGAFLVEEATSGKEVPVRIAAAKELVRRRIKGWEPPLAGLVDALVACGREQPCAHHCGASPAIALLLEADPPRAIAGLSRAWPLAGTETRANILEELAVDARFRGTGSAGGEVDARPLLIQALADETLLQDRRVTLLGVSCNAPAVADLAAIALDPSFRCEPVAERVRLRRALATRLGAR